MRKQELITLVFTYNERENIKLIIENYFSLFPKQYLLVVDDNSPDKTSEIVKRLSEKYENLFLLLRKGEKGRGKAAKEAFQYILERFSSKFIIQMDGDFSHRPETISLILKSLENYDVAIASRFLKGGKDLRKDLLRRSMSRLANIWLGFLFGYHIKDKTSGFSGYRRKVIKKIYRHLKSDGPEIIEEIFYFLKKYGFSIIEIPYEFHERESGETKLDFAKIIRCFLATIKLKLFGSL